MAAPGQAPPEAVLGAIRRGDLFVIKAGSVGKRMSTGGAAPRMMMFSMKGRGNAAEDEAEAARRRQEEEERARVAAARAAFLQVVATGDTAEVSAAAAAHGYEEDALAVAAAHNRVQAVEALLAAAEAGTAYTAALTSPAAARPLAAAAKLKHQEILTYLLNNERIDPSADGNLALEMAAEGGNAEAVAAILAHPRFNPAAAATYLHPGLARALLAASLYGHLDIVQALVAREEGRDALATGGYGPFIGAIQAGRRELVDWMLQSPHIDLDAVVPDEGGAALGTVALCAACEYGCLDIAVLLLQDPRVDPNAQGGRALARAAAHSALPVVQLLLSDARVQPSAGGNRALSKAMAHTRNEVAEALLAHPQFDPHAGMASIIQAGMRSPALLVRVLALPALQDRARYWRAAVRQSAINHAAETEAALVLAADASISAADKALARLQVACIRGKEAEALAALADPEVVNPGADRNAALVAAAGEGCIPVLQALLAHPSVDPNCGGTGEALVRCVGRGSRNAAAVEAMLRDVRVDPSAGGNAALRYIRNTWSCEALRERLLQDPRVAALQAEQSAAAAAAPGGDGWDAIDAVHRLPSCDDVDDGAGHNEDRGYDSD